MRRPAFGAPRIRRPSNHDRARQIDVTLGRVAGVSNTAVARDGHPRKTHCTSRRDQGGQRLHGKLQDGG
jgi:hypothetical protein